MSNTLIRIDFVRIRGPEFRLTLSYLSAYPFLPLDKITKWGIIPPMLKFSFHNSKLMHLAKYQGLKRKEVAAFDLPAGYTCPAADKCRTYSHRRTGKLIRPEGSQFYCYAANLECVFPNTRYMRWENFTALHNKVYTDIIPMIESSLPRDVKIVRIHSSGDFFSVSYFYAWLTVIKSHPEINFFGYSKMLAYVNFVNDSALDNFKLVYSFGGKQDLAVVNEPCSHVVMNKKQADSLGLPLSCFDNPADDYDYIMAGKSFALALHGTQPHGVQIGV